MRRFGIGLLILGAILLVGNPVRAQQGLVETVVNGCKEELEKYCSLFLQAGSEGACSLSDLFAQATSLLLCCISKPLEKLSFVIPSAFSTR